MNVSVVLAGRTAAHVVKNLYPLYLHELLAFTSDERLLPNRHGVLGESPRAKCACRGTVLDRWWSHPGASAYIVAVDGRPGGFALVEARPYAQPMCDFCLYEFFILRPYRRRGVGTQAATRIFESHAGRWELNVLDGNAPALAFWRKVLGRFTEGAFVEGKSESDAFAGCTEFRFVSRGGA